MDGKKWSNIILAGLFGLALILFARILLPFLMPVLLGGFLVVLFRPLHGALQRLLPGRPGLCAGLATVAVVGVLLLPLVLVGWLVGRELFVLAEGAGAILEGGELQRRMVDGLPAGLRLLAPLQPEGDELQRAVLGVVAGGAGFLHRALGMGTALLVDVFLMTVATYYFFLDGRRLVAETERLVPLEARYFRAFCDEFHDVAYAITYGNALTALVQAAVGCVGLVLAGVSHPGVWTLAMALVSLIPVGGTALVWGPLGLGLIVSGRTAEGLFLLAWGALLVSTVDNLVRPRFCSARMTLHPLLVFLSIFGGLAVFGMMGLLVGPLIASFFMSMVRTYRRDFLGLAPLPPPEPVRPVQVAPPVVASVRVSTVPATSAALGGHPGDLG